jgi:hypothetical protein
MLFWFRGLFLSLSWLLLFLVQLSAIKCNWAQSAAVVCSPEGIRGEGHTVMHGKGGRGVPPLFFHGEEAGRLFHFKGGLALILDWV